MSVRLPPKIARNQIAQALVRECEQKVGEKGELNRSDIEGLLRRSWDKKSNSIDKGAAEALTFINETFADKMDSGASSLMRDFQVAYYKDSVMDKGIQESMRMAAEQLALDNRLFTDFVKEDKSEHKQETYEDFREDLQENRVETSDWQSMMLWLQTGRKQNPISS